MRTITGTFGVYNFEAVMPEEIMFIYSRHVYTYLKITDSDGNGVAGLRIQSVLMGANSNTNEYRYTDSNGIVRFDVARLLQTLTNNRYEELGRIEYRTDMFTTWNTAVYSLRFYLSGQIITGTQSQYVNGAHFNADDWWANTRRMKWWRGYPFTFDFVNTSQVRMRVDNETEQTITIPSTDSSLKLLNRVNPEFTGVTSAKRLIFKANIEKQYSRAFSSAFSIYETQAGWAIIEGIVDDTVQNTVVLDIDDCQQIEGRTYLRWLGRHGEVFYWLFFDKSETQAVKSTIYTRPVSDMFAGSQTNRTLDNGEVKDIEKTRSRTIFTEPIDDIYYSYVSQIIDSPYVDMYLGDNKWQRVSVVDASYTQSLKGTDRQKRHRLTININIGER